MRVVPELHCIEISLQGTKGEHLRLFLAGSTQLGRQHTLNGRNQVERRPPLQHEGVRSETEHLITVDHRRLTWTAGAGTHPINGPSANTPVSREIDSVVEFLG
jgi:hypothetical protein